MRACPVCETPSDDAVRECPTCGYAYVRAVVPDVAAGGMAELDLGRVDARSLVVVTELVPDVEHISIVKVGAVTVEVTPDVERTARAPVGEVADDAIPDMELTKLADKEWTPDAEGPVVCPSCQTPQAEGGSIFCRACGYRLPVRKVNEAVLIFAGEGELPSAGAKVDEIKCPMCGCKTPPGGLCRACGVTLRPLEG